MKISENLVRALMVAQSEAERAKRLVGLEEIVIGLLMEGDMPLGDDSEKRTRANDIRQLIKNTEEQSMQKTSDNKVNGLLASIFNLGSAKASSWSNEAKHILEMAYKYQAEEQSKVLEPKHVLLATIDSDLPDCRQVFCVLNIDEQGLREQLKKIL